MKKNSCTKHEKSLRFIFLWLGLLAILFCVQNLTNKEHSPTLKNNETELVLTFYTADELKNEINQLKEKEHHQTILSVTDDEKYVSDIESLEHHLAENQTYVKIEKMIDVSDEYTIKLKIYALATLVNSEMLKLNQIIEVTLDLYDEERNTSKEFIGETFYNLENDYELYVCINGDFYEDQALMDIRFKDGIQATATMQKMHYAYLYYDYKINTEQFNSYILTKKTTLR